MKMSTLKIIYGLVYQIYGSLFYLLAWTFFRIRVYGQKKISLWQKQNNFGCIIVARHLSCCDPVLLAAGFWFLQFRHIFLYNRTRYVAKDNLTVLFKCIPCLTSQVIFINQRNTRKSIIREIINLLREGVNIVIFPEGTVVPKDKRVGGLVTMIVEQVEKMTNQRVAVFPVKIESQGPCAYGKPNGNWLYYLMRQVKIDLKIGKPVFLKDLEKIVSKKVLKKHQREKIVEELLNIADKI